MIPLWEISLAYWLHMLATVVWIGGLATLTLLVIPAARRGLEAEAFAGLLARVQERLDPIGWLCLMVLGATGLFQMSANPNYKGFLTISNRWAAAILTKHIVFLVMIGVSAYVTWALLPQMQRLALLQAAGREAPDSGALAAQEERMMRLSLALGVLILGLTAVARAS
jgi:uncharacterized membrane protein